MEFFKRNLSIYIVILLLLVFIYIGTTVFITDFVFSESILSLLMLYFFFIIFQTSRDKSLINKKNLAFSVIIILVVLASVISIRSFLAYDSSILTKTISIFFSINYLVLFYQIGISVK